MKVDPKIVAKRMQVLTIVLDAAQSKHEKRSKELAFQASKVNLILVAWGFLFAGIAGFYQANILNNDNVQQIIILLTPIFASISICVIYVLGQQKEIDVPDLTILWNQYADSREEDYENFDEISAKEQLAQAYIQAEDKNRKKLANRAYWITLASWAIVIEILLIAIFTVAPKLIITSF